MTAADDLARDVLIRYLHLHSWGVSRSNIAAELGIGHDALDAVLSYAGLTSEPRVIGGPR